MNKYRLKFIAASATGAALLMGLSSMASGAAAANETMPTVTVTAKQEFQGLQHEFHLETGEKLLLAHPHKKTTYRLCVGEFKGSVPLNVLVDDKESQVAVGACETVTGKHIRVEPAAALPGGDWLVARFGKVAK